MSVLDYTPVKKAGLSHEEFAGLCNVNRLTVFNWVHGKTTPSEANKEQAVSTLRALKAAVRTKDLPLDKAVRGPKRMNTLKRIVRQHLT